MKSVNLPYYYINVTIQSRRRQSYFCANSPKLLEFARQPHIFILRRKESKWKRKIKIGLVPKLIIAIIVGILFGQFLPEGFCRFVVTLSGFFSTF